jgi:hypothetical protein
MIKSTLSTILLICLVSFLSAQNEAYQAFNIASKSMEEDPENYLAPLLALEGIEYDSNDPMAQGTMAQALMTYYSFAGDYEKTLEASRSRFGPRRPEAPAEYDLDFLNNHQFVDAKEHILKVANERQVIMINEAHHLPHHRAFVFGLLEDMYKKGFRYFALETLSRPDLNEQGYPDLNSGFYSREPLFGEMLREALQLGYTLIHYENQQECDSQQSEDRFFCNSFRDSIQALNLKQRVIEKDPDAKLFIYAGYSHIDKGSKNSWKKMAQFFQEMTGIEPYCIEQTRLNEQGHLAYEGKIYQTVADKVTQGVPVFAFKDGEPYTQSTFVDISLFHPRSKMINGRPNFYTLGGKKKAYDLKKWDLQEGQLVQAFYAAEKGDRIPADQFVVKTGNERLFLFPGTYELVIRSAEGKVLEKKEIQQFK